MPTIIKVLLEVALLFIVIPLLAMSIVLLVDYPQYAISIAPLFAVSVASTVGIVRYLYKHRRVRVKCYEGP